MRCLVIEHDVGLILIDNGAGNKENEKFHQIYGVENAGANGATRLEDGLAELGFTPSDVALMIDTHLHFDHAGGNTRRTQSGAIELAFPKARYIVQKGEYEYATHTNERTAGSYFSHNIGPVAESNRFEFVEGEREIVKGIRVVPTPGHTPYHQGVLIDGGSERAFFLADLAPTTSHVPLPWIMGYDVEPLRSLETKRAIFTRAAAEKWSMIFEHDARTAWAQIETDGKGFQIASG
jgi:glyoxylase-like metal-dependent hydrolase (beta-lactamase superfamily II)